MCISSGSAVVIDSVVVKMQSVGFLVSVLSLNPELILVALPLVCSYSCLQLIAQSASSVPSPVLLQNLPFSSITRLQIPDGLPQSGVMFVTTSASNYCILDILLMTIMSSVGSLALSCSSALASCLSCKSCRKCLQRKKILLAKLAPFSKIIDLDLNISRAGDT
ncbi:MAG: hypothetical protein EZS28_048933 [Streblomastix strix]|uniref:Uncharacterized protein n=1 Tax=Streblomastix strix TaxID=222440 RepID=A0A5J4TD77_9EUKA|nr:MAG: hypothetical protein EZS28_048933 [Streblomastix strix]